ncbi:MAG: hypothetical protein WCJ09_20210 [Planctomycetota bacterium]
MARKRSWERFGDRRDETTAAALSLYWLDVVEFIPDGDLIGVPVAANEENRKVIPDSPKLTKLKLVCRLMPIRQTENTLPLASTSQCRFGMIHIISCEHHFNAILAYSPKVLY